MVGKRRLSGRPVGSSRPDCLPGERRRQAHGGEKEEGAEEARALDQPDEGGTKHGVVYNDRR